VIAGMIDELEGMGWPVPGSVKHLLNGVKRHVIHLYNMPLCFKEPKPWATSTEQTMKIEIKKIGNSDGLLLPRELMQRLDLKRGQELHITELAGGGFQALPYDPDFERTMEIADQIMDKYRDTLAALAK
jgi:putative addiction module antidote